MKNLKNTITSFIVIATIIMLNVNLFAQVQVKQSVFSNGAAVVSNGTHQLVGTVGQPLVGESSSDNHTSLSGYWYQHIDIFTDVQQIDADLPTKFQLEQNFPNPFNPSTMIQFSLPQKAKVQLKLFDMMGREVATLVNEDRETGVHQVTFEAGELPSGIYLYRIQAEGYMSTKKLTLIK